MPGETEMHWIASNGGQSTNSPDQKNNTMADGMNHVRAIRLAEIMQDFRNTQHYIVQIDVTPTQEEYFGEGYVLLRQCISESLAILRAPFTTSLPTPESNLEIQKEQLQHVILDASSRRFQAQRIYMRATAAVRWVNARNFMLQGGLGLAQNSTMSQVDMDLERELLAITDQVVIESLRTHDRQLGHWTLEDPGLEQIQVWLASLQ